MQPSVIERPQEMRSQLLAHAQTHGVLYDHLLRHFAQERILHRLAESPWGEKLSLQGGWAVATRLGVHHRRLRTVELYCSQIHSVDDIGGIVRDDVGIYSEKDGLHVDPHSVRAALLETDTSAVRIRIKAFVHLDKAQIPIQIDFRINDSGSSNAEMMQMPAMLDMPGASAMDVVRFETVVAEVIWTIVERGNFGFRAPDYYDAWMATQVDPLDDLEEAIRETFRSRATPIPSDLPIGLTEGFAASAHARRHWGAFLTAYEPTTPVEIGDVVTAIREAATPVFKAVHR